MGKRVNNSNPLCADCGREIQPNEWQPPETSLCPACEKKISGDQVAWTKKRENNASVIEQAVLHKKAA
ncbi:MAG: hypothetical protein AB7U29_15540 [Desulfobulbus sp.]